MWSGREWESRAWAGRWPLVWPRVWSECFFFFFSSRRRHTRFDCDWSSDVCSSDLNTYIAGNNGRTGSIVFKGQYTSGPNANSPAAPGLADADFFLGFPTDLALGDRKSTRLNSSHSQISYAVFCLKKKKYPEPTLAPQPPLIHPTPCTAQPDPAADLLHVNELRLNSA